MNSLFWGGAQPSLVQLQGVDIDRRKLKFTWWPANDQQKLSKFKSSMQILMGTNKEME